MIKHERKIEELEQRAGVNPGIPKVCVMFQDGKTINGVDPDNAQMTVKVNLDFDDI